MQQIVKNQMPKQATERVNSSLTQRKEKSLKNLRANQQKPLETFKCDCGNTIRMFRQKNEVKCFGCNSTLKRIEGKWQKQKRQPLAVIECDCGNIIRMFNNSKEVKCFKCDHYHIKDGEKWIQMPYKTPQGELTLADIVVKHRKRG